MLNELLNNKELLYIVLIIIGIILLVILTFLILLEKKNKVKYAKSKTLIENSLENDLNLKNDVTEIIDEQNDKSGKIDLDLVLEKMQESLENKNEQAIKSFEEEQEESAIISYQELLKANGKNFLPEEDGKEQIENLNITGNDDVEAKKFKNSEFISPIYGRVDNTVNYPKISNFRPKAEIVEDKVENNQKIVANSSEVQIEIDKNEKFLKALKQFRNNLE